MPITIELPEELAARLEAAGIHREDASRYAIAALVEAADHAEVRAWWDGLSEAQREAERVKTQESVSAGDAGRSSSAVDVYSRIRARETPRPAP